MKYLLLVVVAVSFGCRAPKPVRPKPPLRFTAASTSSCASSYYSSAKITPVSSASDAWVFVVPMIPGGYNQVSDNTYFRYFDGTNWSPYCWLSDTWYQPPYAAYQPRVYKQMFYITGQYAKIWFRMYNQDAMADECWSHDLYHDWAKYDCGLMDLDSYSNATWASWTP